MNPALPPLDPLSAAELAVLTTPAGLSLLDEVASVVAPGPTDLMRWRGLAAPELVAAAVRIVAARAKGNAKFARAGEMWFSARGLEQSTAEVVARHKAARFDRGTVVDLCAGIGGDSVALAAANAVVAVDLDPAMTARARWNAAVYGVASRIEAVTCRAEAAVIAADAWLHVDPDRRAASPRKSNVVADYAPGLATLLGWTRSARGGAIKLGPASDFATHFGGPAFEVEIISLRGECKEATVWFGDRATPGIQRRATTLPSGATWTDRTGPPASAIPPPSRAEPLDRYVFDPDPSLSRAGLLDGFAASHGWRRVEPGVDLLTGPERTASPFVATFAVVEVFPLDLKILRRAVAARGLGPLTIKTRGLTTSPETWRTQLRPTGPHPATLLLIAGRGHPGRAILAERS